MAEIIVDKYDLDLSGFESSIGKAIDDYDQLNAKAKSAAGQNPFKRQADDLLKYNTQLRQGGTLFQQVSSRVAGFKGTISQASSELVKFITNQNNATKGGDWKATQQKIKDTKSEIARLNDELDKTAAKQSKAASSASSSGSNLGGNLLSSATGLLGTLGFATGAVEIIKGIVSVRAEYQRLGKQLEVTLGSQGAAAAAQKLITDFANKTPHAIADVTSAFNRLVDVGIVPTEKQLFQLSDIAVSKGKTINDYVEAIADAQTGEFERLKEFGIKASKNGDQIIFSFKGQTTAVQNTSSAINDYLLSLGSVAGVAGQTEEAGKTLEGRYSTLKDTFAGIANDIGILIQPALEGLLDVTSQAASGLGSYIKDLQAASSKNGVFSAFVKSIFDPNGFNADATEAIIQQNEAAIRKQQVDTRRVNRRRAEQGKTELFSDDPLLQQAQIKAEQAAESDRANKARTQAAKDEKEAKAAATKQKQIDLDITREKEKQVEERKKLQEQLTSLEKEADKQRLENLDKSGSEYITLKRKLDLAEIEQERKKLIELGQLATGTPYYNTKTKRVEVQKNTDYKLPAATEALFQTRKDAIDATSQTSSFEASEANSRAQFDRQQFLEKTTRERQQNETELELRQKLLEADAALIRKAGESEQDYEKRKNAALLQIRLDYYKKLLDLAEKDPSQKAQILGLKETIAGLQKEIKTNGVQANTGPMDLFDLLGIQFDENSEKNDQLKRVASEAIGTIVSGANELLNQQLQTDQARIQSIDAQLQAKQNEVQVEAQLAAAGLANNLSIKKQEQSQLQAERKKAIDAQRRDQAIQISINTLLQESEMALALSKIISNAASFGPLFPFIVGVSIAAMIAAFAGGITQIAALPKFHDGDEVTHDTARSRSLSGNKRSDEIDARLQVGEGVIRKDSYQPNKVLLSRINKLSRGLRGTDLAELLDGTGVQLPESVKQGDLILINKLNEQRGYAPDTELHKRVDGLHDTMQQLLAETKKGNGTQRQQLADGRIREVDASGNVSVYRIV